MHPQFLQFTGTRNLHLKDVEKQSHFEFFSRYHCYSDNKLTCNQKTCRSLNWNILFSFELNAAYLELFEKFLKKKLAKDHSQKPKRLHNSTVEQSITISLATKCYGFKWQLDNYVKEKSMEPIYWLCYRTEQPWASRNRVTEENLFIRNILLVIARSTSELTSKYSYFYILDMDQKTFNCLIFIQLVFRLKEWRAMILEKK